MRSNSQILEAILRHQAAWLRIPAAGENPLLTPILDTVCQSIRQSKVQTEQSIQQMHEELAELGLAQELMEEHEALVEELLGAAFVVLQRTMNAFSSRVLRVSNLVATHYSIARAFDTRYSVLKFGAPMTTQYSLAIVVNAFANYYKHRDEATFWTDQKAAPIVSAHGLSVATTANNMRLAARALGASEHDLWPLIDGLAAWSKEVSDHVRAKI